MTAPLATELHRIGPWTICETDDHSEPDCRKLAWFAVHEDSGETRSLDLSPYAPPTFATFHRLVAMDFPTRASMPRTPNGPLSVADVAELWQRRKVAA